MKAKVMKLPAKNSKTTYFFTKRIAFIQKTKNKKGYLHISMKIALLRNKILVQISSFWNLE